MTFKGSSLPLLTKAEEEAVIRRLQSGDQSAKELLVQRNFRLITAMAKKWSSPLLAFEDGVQEAALGLLHAATLFDFSRNVKFSTYAVGWMRQYLRRAVEKHGRLVRVPSHALERHRALLAAEHKLRNRYGREPTDEELGLHLEWPADRVTRTRTDVEQPLSLDAIWGDRDEGENLGTLVEDEDAAEEMVSTPERVTNQELIDAILADIPAGYADLLRRRFGLEPYEAPQSLQQVADAQRRSREGVRQREVRAIRYAREAAGRLGIELADLM